MKCTLVIENDPGNFKTFEFNQDEITIGRVMGNDIMINDRSISQYHVKIVFKKGRVELIDWESRNGTKLNKAQVKKAILYDQDIIELSKIPVKFICPEVPSESTAEHTVLAPARKLKINRAKNFL
jgi:pSer/pThr/pTyr-binding forkhead associated (FHA) protein